VSEPIMVMGNGWCRAYDDLDRRIAATPQSEWTPEMIARVKQDQQAKAWPPKQKDAK